MDNRLSPALIQHFLDTPDARADNADFTWATGWAEAVIEGVSIEVPRFALTLLDPTQEQLHLIAVLGANAKAVGSEETLIGFGSNWQEGLDWLTANTHFAEMLIAIGEGLMESSDISDSRLEVERVVLTLKDRGTSPRKA